tara:strand:- start:2860 stop:3771 length:912 start_codon:yes stop_codon:yes gene_type:complete
MIGISGYSGLLGSSILRKSILTNTQYKIFGRRKDPENSIDNFAYLNLNNGIDKNFINELKGITTFIHCASQIKQTKSLSNLNLIHREFIERNALFQSELIEACIKADVKKLVIISGTNNLIPNQNGFIDKESGFQTRLNSSYLISKMVAELLSKTYINNNIFIQIIRPSSIYGPNAKYGLVNKFINNLMLGKEIFISGDGSWSSDLVYVDDVTDVIFKLINNFKINEINIGTGQLTSILNLAHIICNALNCSTKLIKFQKQNNIKSNQNIFYPVETKDCEKILNRKLTSVSEGISNIINNFIK